jgi:hypothetical protein
MAITPQNINVAASRPHFEQTSIIFIRLPNSAYNMGTRSPPTQTVISGT